MQSISEQHNSYIQTEFFFYMLPSYYAIVAFLLRYHQVMKDMWELNVETIPAENPILYLEDRPGAKEGLPCPVPPASYTLKCKLCLLNSYLYLIMWVFGLIGTETLFYASKHKYYSIYIHLFKGFVYLLGFVSWSLAALVLRREYQRKKYQSLWTHRFFWVFSGTFAFTKMFEDYLLPLNFMLNVISLLTNAILILYALYRSEDNHTIQLIHNQDIPSPIKWIFQNLQLNSLIRKLFQINDPSTQIQQLLKPDEIEEEDLKQLEQMIKITPKNVKQEMDLLSTLPRRNVFVDKKLRYMQTQNHIIKYYYFVLTQIGKTQFQVQRTYQEFQSLEATLFQTFNEKNFPTLNLPKLPRSDHHDSVNYSENVQNWLSNLFKKPLFMIKPLLVFLNIDSENSKPFQTYYECTYKSFCSNSYLLASIKSRNEKKRKTTIGYFEEGKEKVKVSQMITEKCSYEVRADKDVYPSPYFYFQIECQPQNRKLEHHKWKIQKSEGNILQLNSKIEDQCKISISFYYQLVSQAEGKSYHQKLELYTEYLQNLLKSEKYYCLSLFQFVRFDPIDLEVKFIGSWINFDKKESEQKNQRASHYMQQYSQEGSFIEIIRVDRLMQNSFQFKVKRNAFILSKKSEEFHFLRKRLQEVYQGVSNVPQIDFEKCSKDEAKKRAQQFLMKIQLLPKIKINNSFLSFYEHSL